MSDQPDGPGRFGLYHVPDAGKWQLDLGRPGEWTRKDIELIDAIAGGCVVISELAERFQVTEGSMRNHLSRLNKKTKSRSMAELTWNILKGRL